MYTAKTKRRVSIKMTSLDKVNEVLSNFKGGEVELFLSVEDSKNTYKLLSTNPYIEDWDFAEETEKEEAKNDEESDPKEPEPEPKPEPMPEPVDTNKPEEITEPEVKEEVKPKEEVVEKKKSPRNVKSEAPKKEESLQNEVANGLMEKVKEELLKRAPELEALTSLAKEEEEDTGELILPDVKINDMVDLARMIEASWHIARKSPAIRYNTSFFRTQVKKEYEILLDAERDGSANNFSDKTTRAVARLLLGVYYSNPKGEGVKIAFQDTMEKIREHYDSLKSVDTFNKAMNLLYRNETN